MTEEAPTAATHLWRRLKASVRVGVLAHASAHGIMYLESHAYGVLRQYADPGLVATFGEPDPAEVLAVLQATAAAVDEVREIHRIDGIRGLQAALDQARADLGGGRS